MKYVWVTLAAGLSGAFLLATIARADDLSDNAGARAHHQRTMHEPESGGRGDFDHRQGGSSARPEWSWYGRGEFGYATWRPGRERADYRSDLRQRGGEWSNDDQRSGHQTPEGFGRYGEFGYERSDEGFHGPAAWESRFDEDRRHPGRWDDSWGMNFSGSRSEAEPALHELRYEVVTLQHEIERLRAEIESLPAEEQSFAPHGQGRVGRHAQGEASRDWW
jgi:hypothetical protein